MKTIILNGSPRRNGNTAQLLRAAQKGAESAGSETEYIDLYGLDFTGCRSCMVCKKKGSEHCRCFRKDDLSPILDRIFEADALIIGSPVYFGDTTSQFHALAERLGFVLLSYDDYRSLFEGRVNVGIILTMNAPVDIYHQYYEAKFNDQFRLFGFLNGKTEVLPSCDTLQVNDYSKYDMAGFNEEHKKAHHEQQFPIDLEEAFRLGERLIREK
ncbi:MAG: flavodoxin family protein [Methanosarcinaceae archaeon]|nr:flavodoxin family protein [Methanosarcinaceae archaeon]